MYIGDRAKDELGLVITLLKLYTTKYESKNRKKQVLRVSFGPGSGDACLYFQQRRSQVDFWEFKARLIYRARTRTVRAT